MNYTYENKVALVTGGTGALGRAVTEAFVKSNASVFVSYIIPQEVTVLKNQLGQDQNKVTMIESDLMKEDSVNELVETVLRQSHRIDVLANVVGRYAGGPAIHETKEKDFDFILNLNMRTAFLISKAVLPSMIRNKHGKIVHIASRTGFKGDLVFGRLVRGGRTIKTLMYRHHDQRTTRTLQISGTLALAREGSG